MDIKFRTITNLKNFSDNEVFEPETSETEPGQAVDIKSVYLRCLRGEISPVRPGGFDIKPGMTVGQAISRKCAKGTPRKGFPPVGRRTCLH